MEIFKRWYVRILAFFVGFLLLNFGVELAFLTVETGNLLSMTDMKASETAEMYFVGSSWFRNELIPSVVTEESGVTSFNLSAEAVEIPSQKTIIKELFKYHSPKYIVVDYDVRSYLEATSESPIIPARMWPFLSWDNRAESLIVAAQEDGAWLDRLFPWRYYHAQSIRNLGGNTLKKLFPEYFRDIYANDMSPDNPEALSHYTGAGHFGYVGPGMEDYHREHASVYRARPDGALNETSAAGFLDLKELCEAHNCQLIVMVPPFHRAQILSDEAFLKGGRAIMDFCEENDIPCWNFILAPTELVPPLDHTFGDDTHFNMEGAVLYSRGVGQVVKTFVEGGDVSAMFWDEEAFLASVDSILNTFYMTEESGDSVTYTAYVNAGSVVKPLYQFALVQEDGKEEIVKPYGADNVLTLKKDQLNGKTVKLYAKNGANPAQDVKTYIK